MNWILGLAFLGMALIVLIETGVFIVYPSLSPYTSTPVSGNPAETGTTIPVITASDTRPMVSSLPPEISQEQAITLVREDYYRPAYSVARIALTDRYAKTPLYEIDLAPVEGLVAEQNETVFIDATTGDYYSPAQESARISVEQAKEFARNAFPHLSPDRVKIRFSDGSQYALGWEFTLMQGDEKLVQGGLAADTGDLKWYAFPVLRKDRPANPSISLDAAKIIAEREIRNRNGVLPVAQTDARLDPLGMPGEKIAGKYVVVYTRIIRNVPCDSDSLVVTVDSVTGKVTRYSKQWILPENAVVSMSPPAISREAAAGLVEREARKRYPASAGSLTIISADLRWMDYHNPDQIIPAPGDIPLAWKVQFDDAVIRSQQWPNPGTGWVDAQNGTLLDLYYRH
ncbi:hypothetical protein [Methanoregula sp.]|uniref:hypothetical protein n=1 Tax=Methanoregula sp. TaxID=2052170 RepID=UPI003562A5E7